MSQKKNFIKTTDKETAERLISAGFQLISQSNGVYTFLNQPSQNFSVEDVDKTKMVYTNMLNV